ncbi:MAG: BPSS1780 family membrane protein [Burkholderiales bacterium]|nr:BPSS1780 family membrane protein [Burkholderiales bacterium]
MRIVAARNGLAWIAAGVRLFARAPFGWIFGVFAYWGLMLMSNLVPIVGPLAATVTLPAFSVSFMAFARAAEAGQPIMPPLLFAGFSRNVRALLVLGAVYLASVFAILGVSALADGGMLAKWLIAGAPPAEGEAREDVANAALLALAAYAPVLAAFWFAPVLAAWRDLPPAKALFFSFFAVLRNWRAFLAYGAGLAAAAIPAGLVFSFAVSALGSFAAGFARDPAERLAVAMFAASPLVFAAASVLFASFYASWRDVFPAEPAPSDAPAAAPA